MPAWNFCPTFRKGTVQVVRSSARSSSPSGDTEQGALQNLLPLEKLNGAVEAGNKSRQMAITDGHKTLVKAFDDSWKLLRQVPAFRRRSEQAEAKKVIKAFVSWEKLFWSAVATPKKLNWNLYCSWNRKVLESMIRYV
ncbi:hypothetical protein JCM5353_008304 [Sporobolomyces roseus]